jgi:tRNA modification GTPase
LALKLSKKETLTPRLATLSFLHDKLNDAIDQAIVIYFKAPHSFTAEDVVEFQCHGGSVVAGLVLETLLHHGARLANPGEFSKRAFLNGRIDLSEAEAIAALIETKSVDAAKMLTRQLKGELRDFVGHVRELLIEILAFVEVNIDYAEEDLPLDMIEKIKDKLDVLAKELFKTYESSKRRQGLINGFKIAIVGKPNVGKSSLLNNLLSYDRAIISDIAGTTRDTIEEELRIGSHLVRIVDTAGIRQANDVIEKIGIERSIAAIEESEIVIAMFDNSKPCDHEDEEMLSLLQKYTSSKQILTVLNKIDLPDLYESYCGSILATAALGASAFYINPEFQLKAVFAPMLIAAVGILLSVIGIFMVRTKEGAGMKELLRSLGVGVNFSSLLIALATFGIMYTLQLENWVGISFSVVTGLLAGIIIGVLGVLDDITISQSAIVFQLKEANEKLKFNELYKRAMNVGQDHISSMVNTLVLVYTGAVLPLLLLFIDNPHPFTEIINYEIVADEIVRTLVGSIGLIMAVPITTVIATLVATSKER